MRLTEAQERTLEEATCQKCFQAGGLTVEYRLTAMPIGSFSLAGAQMKVSALEWPWLMCRHCGAECQGKQVTTTTPEGT